MMTQTVYLNHFARKGGFRLQFLSMPFNSPLLERSDAYPFPKQQILNSSKLKEFADDNFKFDENGRKLSKWIENTVGK